MRKVIFIWFLLAFFFSINFSCKKESDEERVYYQFTDEDVAILPVYTKGQELVFKNQNQDEMVFIVSSARLEKVQKTSHGFFGTVYLYFYDRYESYVGTYVNHRSVSNSLRFRREPIDIDAAQYDYTVLYPNKLYGVVGFPMQNRAAGFDINTEYSEIIEMNDGNGVLHNIVRVFETNNMNVYSPGDGVERTVHTFYYSDDFGFIGFDDIFGYEWRLKY